MVIGGKGCNEFDYIVAIANMTNHVSTIFNKLNYQISYFKRLEVNVVIV